MQRPSLGLAVALALVAPGCLGSVTAATLPDDALASENWREARRDRQSVAMGTAEVVLVDYAPRDNRHALGAGITVATGNDVPLYDEAALIPEALSRIEERKGVEFREIGDRSIQLTNAGGSVTGTEYAIDGAPGNGRALVFEVDCDDFVVVAAWGATESGLLGGGNLYQEALDVARNVRC